MTVKILAEKFWWWTWICREDPLSLMHRFKVENGKVTYQSKYLQSGMWMWFLTLRPSPNLKWLRKIFKLLPTGNYRNDRNVMYRDKVREGLKPCWMIKFDLNAQKIIYLNAVNDEGKIIKSIWMCSDHKLWTITLFNHPGLVWPSEEQYRSMIAVEANQECQVVRVEVYF